MTRLLLAVLEGPSVKALEPLWAAECAAGRRVRLSALSGPKFGCRRDHSSLHFLLVTLASTSTGFRFDTRSVFYCHFTFVPSFIRLTYTYT